MSSWEENLTGKTLVDTYVLQRLLGRGGMGAVYQAGHLRTGGLCAVKLLHPEAQRNPEIYRRFTEEARTVSALRHPHIVQVTDFNEEGGLPFIVMEYLDGATLDQRLQEVPRLPLPQVVDLCGQVGGALHAAHLQGVVHRDVKPQNIFLQRSVLADEERDLAKVLDFGISKIRRSRSQATRDLAFLGTPHFMSPEAALGQNTDLDGRADQFALAVILYLLLSGRLPFDGDDLTAVLYQVVHEPPPPLIELAPHLPRHMTGAVHRALCKRKEERYPDMVQFVRAFRGGVSGPIDCSRQEAEAGGAQKSPIAREQATRLTPGGPAPVTRPRARRLARRAATGLLLAGALGGAALCLRLVLHHPPAPPPAVTSAAAVPREAPAAALARSPAVAPVVPAAAPPVPAPRPPARDKGVRRQQVPARPARPKVQRGPIFDPGL